MTERKIEIDNSVSYTLVKKNNFWSTDEPLVESFPEEKPEWINVSKVDRSLREHTRKSNGFD